MEPLRAWNVPPLPYTFRLLVEFVEVRLMEPLLEETKPLLVRLPEPAASVMLFLLEMVPALLRLPDAVTFNPRLQLAVRLQQKCNRHFANYL